MHVTYEFWTILSDAKKCGAIADGRNYNYQLTMDRAYAYELYMDLKKEFEK